MKKQYQILILIVLIIVIVIFNSRFLNLDKEEIEEAEFSYEVSLLEWQENSEDLNKIRVEENKVIIRKIFTKPTPCEKLNYEITKNDSLIIITPKLVHQKPLIDPETGKEINGVCGTILSGEYVEIVLTLSKGDYIIKTYDYWIKDSPFSIDKVMIEKELSLIDSISPEKSCILDNDCVKVSHICTCKCEVDSINKWFEDEWNYNHSKKECGFCFLEVEIDCQEDKVAKCVENECSLV